MEPKKTNKADMEILQQANSIYKSIKMMTWSLLGVFIIIREILFLLALKWYFDLFIYLFEIPYYPYPYIYWDINVTS